MPKLNQKYIADALNLSRTTVSRCFTNHPKINPETRAKVFKLAAEMGYSYSTQRNAPPKLFAGRKTIAVLVGIGEEQRKSSDTATAEELLIGISEKAAVEKLELEIHYVDPVDFLPPARARRIVKSVSCLDCINQDQIRGISRLMDHLHKLGHRRMGFLSWKYPVHTPWVERRLGAYAENIYRLGLELDPDLILNLRPHEHIPLDVLAAQVAGHVKSGVTAWVCAADHQAYHLIGELQKLGIRVPEDCSVTGFDGVTPPPGMPQATTIRVPFRDVGISAISSLLRKIDHPNTSRRNIQVSGDLVVGETTASPNPAYASERE